MTEQMNKEQQAAMPEWKTILENLLNEEQIIIYRLCRKLIIYLDRLKIPEISDLIRELTPKVIIGKEEDNAGLNWPRPKGVPFNTGELVEKVFAIADKYLDDDEITRILTHWVHQEQMGSLSLVLENRNAPLNEVIEAVREYLNLSYTKGLQSLEERIGLRVSLIYRFLSENLTYVNKAKHYITISEMKQILERVFGPASGNGKLGGKSAGLILARQILINKRKELPILNKFTTPKSRFLTSDGLLEYMHYNALDDFVFMKYQNAEAIQQEYPFLEYIFKNSFFPPESIYAFNKILDDMEDKPIVVRSSSLLEDSFEGAFSGKYKSLFLANIGTREERLSALMNAVSEVYASAFGPDPIEYRKNRNLLDFREEMGILIQQVVGNRIGKYYLPSFAGVAFSNNEFRWSPRIKREDGVVRIVAGLGTRAVDRIMDDYPVLFSPGQPGLKVNQTPQEIIQYSQRYIDVINLETNRFETIRFIDLIKDCKGNYPGLEKIVSFNRLGALVDPISAMSDFLKEDLVITFNPLIQKTDFTKQLKIILQELQKAFGGPVDIEFASDGEQFYLLQCRPQSLFVKDASIRIPPNISSERIIFTANQFVNNGLIENIKYMVYVEPCEYSRLETYEDMTEIGRIVSRLNRLLPKRKFILLGPGRWGSKGDIKLGVPVVYSDINNTAMLIEIAKERAGYVPELSFGTHFFQDLVESNIKYLPLYPDKKDTIFNEGFLIFSKNRLGDFIPEAAEYEDIIKVISLDDLHTGSGLCIYMDGESSKAVAVIEK